MNPAEYNTLRELSSTSQKENPQTPSIDTQVERAAQLVDFASSLTQVNMNDTERASFNLSIQTIEEPSKDPVLAVVLRILEIKKLTTNEEISFQDQENLNAVISDLSPEDRNETIKFIEEHFQKYIEADERGQTAIDYANMIPELVGECREKLLEVLTSIHIADDRQEFIYNVQQKFTEDMDAKNIIMLIQNLAFIHVHRRADDFASMLTQVPMNLEERALLNQKIECIDPPNRIKMVQIVSRLFDIIKLFRNEEMSGDVILQVIEDLAPFSSEELDQKIQKDEALLDIFSLKDQRNQTALDYADRLPMLRGRCRQLLLEVLSSVETADDKAAFVRYASTLITQDMNNEQKSQVIRILNHIHDHDRELFFNHVCSVIREDMTGGQIIDMMNAFAFVPVEHRALHILDLLQRIEEGQYLDVHAEGRDQKVMEAFLLLRESQESIEEVAIQNAKDHFIQYLNSMEEELETKIGTYALLIPKQHDQDWGPLISDENFTIHGLELSGAELIGRLWIFASNLTDIKDQEMAKEGMVMALKKDSYSNEERVCNQGKMQYLIIRVLQGRLDGVNIDGEDDSGQLSTKLSVRAFFDNQKIETITELGPLLEAAKNFCDSGPRINKEAFLKCVKKYAYLQGIIEESFFKENNNITTTEELQGAVDAFRLKYSLLDSDLNFEDIRAYWIKNRDPFKKSTL